MKNRRRLTVAAVIIPVLAVALIGANNYLFMTRVAVINRSTFDFDKVTIVIAGDLIANAPLADGASLRHSGNPARDGAIAVTLQACGKDVGVEFAYVTRDMGQAASITILRPENPACVPLSVCNFGVCDLMQACGATPVFTANCAPDALRWELGRQSAGDRTPGSN